MAFVIMSCKDDTTSPNDDKDFTIITNPGPLNIIIKTYNDEVLIDSVRVYVDNFMLVPEGFYYNSEFITNYNIMGFRFYNSLDDRFDLNIDFENDSFKKGNYSFRTGTSEYTNYYINPKLNSRYVAESGYLRITEVKYIGEMYLNNHYITGEFETKFEKQVNDNHTTRVKVIFENLGTFVGGV